MIFRGRDFCGITEYNVKFRTLKAARSNSKGRHLLFSFGAFLSQNKQFLSNCVTANKYIVFTFWFQPHKSRSLNSLH